MSTLYIVKENKNMHMIKKNNIQVLWYYVGLFIISQSNQFLNWRCLTSYYDGRFEIFTHILISSLSLSLSLSLSTRQGCGNKREKGRGWILNTDTLCVSYSTPTPPRSPKEQLRSLLNTTHLPLFKEMFKYHTVFIQKMFLQIKTFTSNIDLINIISTHFQNEINTRK